MKNTLVPITFLITFIGLVIVSGLMVYLTWPTVFAGPLKILVTNGWMPSEITLTEAICLQFLFGSLFKTYHTNQSKSN